MSIPSWVPTVISIIALTSSIGFGFLAASDRKANFEISREREIYSWAVQTLGITADLYSANTEVIEKARAALSVQIDIGRLLFPNDQREEFGTDKHPLNWGYRSEVLDPLVAIQKFESPLDKENEMEFEKYRKDFIWELSKYFPPVKQNTSPESRAQYSSGN